MASDISEEQAVAVRAGLSKDNRNIVFIWNEAIRKYNESASEDRKTAADILTTPKYRDARELKAFGNREMQRFDKFRDDGKKMNKVKTLFMQNIDFIEAGSKQLLSAVSASFPPALAISTAMTFVLSGFRSVSADYDMVVNFFEDMNNFLQRVTIIAERVPTKDAYQNALMDVFASMLSLCGAARNYIVLGKFKKWVINSFFGDDTALKGGRQQMDTSLARLQSATELAILDNTENMLDKQVEMGKTLSKLRRDLNRNQEVRDQIALDQNAALEHISVEVLAIRADLGRLLSIYQAANPNKDEKATKVDKVSGNVVRHIYGFAAAKGLMADKKSGPFPDMTAVLTNIEKSRVENTGSWIFEHRDWLAWKDASVNSPSVLWLEGGSGMGKTHLSLAIYQHLCDNRPSEQEVCVTFFSCHRPDDQRRHMRDLLRNCAIQIADESPIIRQRLQAKWRNLQMQAHVVEKGLAAENDLFIYDNFSETSSNQLLVVVDGIDHFYDEEFKRFLEVLNRVETEKLRIKFVVTLELTDEFPEEAAQTIRSQAIRIGRDDILPDLRKILWARINSEDSAYDGLRKLSKHNKQKIAQSIKDNADSLLYVEETLRFLADRAREGEIEGFIDSLPANLTELYEAMLQRSLRTLSSVSVQGLKSIVVWLAFSYHPLTLERLGLLTESAGLTSEQVLSFVLQFFEVDVLSKDTTSLYDIEFAELFEDTVETSTEKLLLSDRLRLQIRNRATRNFFSSAGSKHALRTSFSDAHRRIFLDTVSIITQPKTNESLYEYSVEHSLIHWCNITPAEHTKEEQVQVCTAFVRLISSSRFATGLAKHPYCQWLGQIISSGWEGQWAIWSSHMVGIDMTSELNEYWQPRNGDDALYPLVISLVRCWLESLDVKPAVKAWRWANDVRKTVHGAKSLKSYDDGDVFRLAGILGVELSSHAHFAIASVLALEKFYRRAPALEELKSAWMKSDDEAFRNRCHVQMALVNSQYVRDDERLNSDVLECCKLALEDEQTDLPPTTSDQGPILQITSAKSAVEMQHGVVTIDSDPAEFNAFQQSARVAVLGIQAMAMKGLAMNIEAAESFCEARRVSTKLVPPEYLFNELFCLQGEPVSMIDRLLSFSYTDQLRFLTGEFYTGEPGHEVRVSPQRLIMSACAKSHKSDRIVKIYRELIKGLDAAEAGAPLRVDLARILWRLRDIIKPQRNEGRNTIRHGSEPDQSTESSKQDRQLLVDDAQMNMKDAKILLNQVLDSISDEKTYQITQADPLSVANSALLLMTDILLEEFRSSKKVEDKVQILLQAKELPHRKFLASQPLITDDTWHPYSTAVAYMLKKMGPISEYEQVTRTIFEEAIKGYGDDTEYNDKLYLTSLSRIFMMEPSLHKYGQMLSAVKEVEDAIFCCDGICLPITVFDWWESDDPCHRCLICLQSRLCEACHKLRMQWNTDPKTKLATDPDFCCPNGQYMRDPVESWQNKDGYMQFKSSNEGEEPISIEVDSVPEYIEKVWRDAWEKIASGI